MIPFFVPLQGVLTLALSEVGAARSLFWLLLKGNLSKTFQVLGLGKLKTHLEHE